MEEVEGHRTRTRLFAGEPILKTRITGKGSDASVAPIAQRRMHLVAVKVDAVSGTGSLILPGDKVDVLVHLLQNQAAGIVEPMTRTILQDIKVFAVDATTNTDGMDNDVKSISAKTVSLLVSPEQAQKVTLATEMGQVRLVLRSPEDDGHSEVAGVSCAICWVAEKSPATTVTARPASRPGGTAMDVGKRHEDPAAGRRRPRPTPPVKAAPAVPKFIMRLVLGTKTSEVVMEPETDETGAQPTRASGGARRRRVPAAAGR